MCTFMKKTDFTCFFWLTDPTNPESELTVYRFKTVLFGAVSSPFVLHVTLYRHLQYHNTPLSRDIQTNLYIDNIISGSATEAMAVQYYHNARAMLSEAGFNLRAWISNSQQVHTTAEQDKTIDTSTPSNVLGIHWNAMTDQLSLISKGTDLTSELTTKREVLQESSSIFDLIGFATPVTIHSKLLIQKLWQMKIEWNEPLETDLNREWLSIAKDMNQLSNHLANLQNSLTCSRQDTHSPNSLSMILMLSCTTLESIVPLPLLGKPTGYLLSDSV